ncbi:MAG: DNA repair protein RecO [Gammaproteobacteria bacterium]
MQTRVTDQPAYLLHRRDWKNTSIILDILTLDFGRISVLAKAGRKSRSKSLYQPFCRLSLSWTGRSELKTLVGIDGSEIRIDEQHYLPLLYINELLCAYLPWQEAMPDLFQLYDELLGRFDLCPDERHLREFERSAMTLLGYMPNTAIDSRSGKPIEAGGHYQFLATEGFALVGEAEANIVSGRTIIAWNQRQYDNKQVSSMAKIVMRSIIDFNLHGKRLKSRDIYQQIKSRI